nr:haloacid dehalogenase-like hydrolase [uncultured Oscillibacter sp.]
MKKQLDRGCWEPNNWERLNHLIEANAFRGRYACFDFDDTTSIHAVDHALFSYQVRMLRFAIPPEQFQGVLSTGLDDLTRVLARNAEGKPVRCGKIIQDLNEDYGWLCRNQAIGADDTLLFQIRQTPEYRDFAAKLHWMRGMLDKAFPTTVSYPWCIYLLTGFTPEEVYQLGCEAIEYAMGAGHYGTVTLCSPEERQGAAGVVHTTEESGLVFSPEIRDLYQTLQANGIRPYLVSASPAELVRAGSSQVGLGVPPEQIFAMRALRDENGRYCCAYDYDWGGRGRYAQTFGPGKSQVISRFIAPAHGGRGPLLVCGDAESDMDMMTDWMECGDTETGLIFNHLRSRESHPRLWRAAHEAAELPGGRFLLQGLDKHKGRFCPAQTTIGENGEQPRLFCLD